MKNRLRAVLARRRLSQTDLAALAGLPYTTIRRLARRGSNPPLEHALRIGSVLDASVGELFSVGGMAARAGRQRHLAG